MKKLFGWLDKLINRLVTNVTLWIVAAVLVLGIVAYTAYSTIFIRLPEPPVYATYQVLPPQRAKGAPAPDDKHRDYWTKDQRERYYQTSQGSLVIPYEWFRALEWRTGTEMFAAPNVQAKFGLLPDNNVTYNKDLMPVGIVKNVVRNEYVHLLGDDEKYWASISCAACHTGQLTYRGHAMRIDGNQSFWNFDKWSGDLVFSLMLTSTVPEKFERFCSRVNGLAENGRCTPEAKKTLREHINKYLHSDLVMNAINAILQHTYPTTESFTRTAALGRGINGIYGPWDKCNGLLDRHCYRNVYVNTGPVSYPPLWYTNEYDWVQSTAQIRQPLGRNVTESWGVSVHVWTLPDENLYASTHNIDDMFWMETLLSILQAPQWPEEIFSEIGESGKINLKRVERGKYLYEQAIWADAPAAEDAELPADPAGHMLGPNPLRPKTGYCARCHAPAFEPAGAWPTTESTASYNAIANLQDTKFLQLPLYRLNVMGTDPDDANEFAATQVWTRDRQPLFKDVKAPDTPQRVGIGTALSVNITGILKRWFKENNVPPECEQVMSGHRQNLFRAPLGYPARPLDGYWATGPFLHNGSVRTLYELLSPVSERAKTFWIGSREFDPVYLGFQNDAIEGAFLYDTTKKGNSNVGHEFNNAPRGTKGVIGPYLSIEDRLSILEYLKVLRSVQEYLDADPATKDRLFQRNALLAAMSQYYEERYKVAGAAKWVEPGNLPESEGGFPRADFCRDILLAARGQFYGSATPTPTPNASPTASPTATPAPSATPKK